MPSGRGCGGRRASEEGKERAGADAEEGKGGEVVEGGGGEAAEGSELERGGGKEVGEGICVDLVAELSACAARRGVGEAERGKTTGGGEIVLFLRAKTGCKEGEEEEEKKEEMPSGAGVLGRRAVKEGEVA